MDNIWPSVYYAPLLYLKKIEKNVFDYYFIDIHWPFVAFHMPVNVELVKIRTIFELTGGNDSNEPANIKSVIIL